MRHQVLNLYLKFKSVCYKLKTVNIPEYETMRTLQKRIDFLQIEVASKDALIKTLIEMQTGFLESGTNCISQDKGNMSSINIKQNSFIPANNSRHKRKRYYDLISRESNSMNIYSNQNEERTHSVNPVEKLADKKNRKEIRHNIQKVKFQKRNSCLSEGCTVAQLKRIFANSVV